MIMCCGCRRLLGRDGSAIVLKSIEESAMIAIFKNRTEADSFAESNKWSTKDPDGTSNHRCPECQFDPQTFGPGLIDELLKNIRNPHPEGYGAFLDAQELFGASR